MNRPPFTISPTILRVSTDLAKLLGHYEALIFPVPEPTLRRQNQIRTVQGSVAIEGNTLTLEQVTAIIDNKRVAGPAREILEVQNAIRAYALAPNFKGYLRRDLLKAHAILLAGLVASPGRYRTTNVGIIKGTKVGHIAPKPIFVPKLMDDLLDFVKTDRDVSVAIKACIFHYELEFIHPFVDGNGRMGRLWQQVILLAESPVFGYIPVESLVKERQQGYYEALSRADHDGEATPFIEFMLKTLHDALAEFVGAIRVRPLTAVDRLQMARERFGLKEFARKNYLELFKDLSTATASRDLLLGVEKGWLHRSGTKAKTNYSFK